MTPFSCPYEVFFVWLALVIAGVILGLTGKITVFRDISDLSATFGVFLALWAFLFGTMSHMKDWMMYLIAAIAAILFIISSYRAFKDNSILGAPLALITKMSLSFMIVLKVVEVFNPSGKTSLDRYRNKASAAAWVTALATLSFALVRDKSGRQKQASVNFGAKLVPKHRDTP